MPKPLCSCILADMMLRCFYSEGLCLYRFVCLAFRCIIVEGPILTSVPKQFVFFLFFAHSPLAIKPRSLPWVTDLVLSRTFLSRKSSRCTILSAVNVRIIIACCFFWGFTWLFGTGTLLWAVVCEKEASLFPRSEAQIQCESEELLSHWLSCWRCGLLMKELYVKIIVGQIIMWRLIYDVGSVWWLLLIKVLRFLLQVRGHSSWDLRRRSCKDEVNVP